jgi:hypothetical protein
MTGAVLGCASAYRAEVHWRGGGRVFHAHDSTLVTAVSWERVLSGTSAASVTLAKNSTDQACCDRLGQIEPWCHELTVYRDDQLVWQGPITKVTWRRASVQIDALDVTAWLARLVNRFNLAYTAGALDATAISVDVISRSLNDATMSVPVDYPAMLAYLHRQDCGSKPGFNKGPWIAYVLDIVTELAKFGFDWTTVGRSLYLRDRLTSTATAQAGLGGDDVLGDIDVVRAGESAATACFATTQTDDLQQGTGRTVWSGTTGTPYGRLDTLVHLQDPTTSDADLRQAGLMALGGRYPAPLTVSVPDNSQLSPTAPVTVAQLVCGERIDVALSDFCRSPGPGPRPGSGSL